MSRVLALIELLCTTLQASRTPAGLLGWLSQTSTRLGCLGARPSGCGLLASPATTFLRGRGRIVVLTLRWNVVDVVGFLRL